jgi:hypothetical protein
MPVRSLHTSVIKWPDRQAVVEALMSWIQREKHRHPRLLKLGYHGSYADGTWGVGSDLDLIAIVEESEEPFEERGLNWHFDDLPVPVELVVYSRKEWRALKNRGSRFAATIERQAVWVYEKKS